MTTSFVGTVAGECRPGSLKRYARVGDRGRLRSVLEDFGHPDGEPLPDEELENLVAFLRSL